MLAIISLLSAAIQAQTCQGATGTVLATFNQCITNQLQANNAAASCDSLKEQQDKYYQCLCEKNRAIVGCYTNFCSADLSLSSYQQATKQFCDASDVASKASGPKATGTLPAVTVAGTAVSYPTGKATPTNGAMALSVFLVFAEVAALTIFSNLM